MDSEHRHELKTNELADLLTHFPEFLKRNAYTIVGVVLIVVGVISWPLLTNMKREKTITEESQVASAIQMLSNDIRTAYNAYKNSPEQLNPALNSVLANADALMQQTDETDNPNLAALAYIKAGQAIRTELHLRKDVVSPDTIQTQIQKAADAYEKADQSATYPALKAMAQLGKGLCAEERGQQDDARDIYQTILDDKTFAATLFPEIARQRLETMQDISHTFTFVEAPKEAPVAPETTPTPEISIPKPQLTPEVSVPEAQPAPEISIPEAPETPTQPAEAQPQTPAAEQPKDEQIEAPAQTPDTQPQPAPAQPEQQSEE